MIAWHISMVGDIGQDVQRRVSRLCVIGQLGALVIMTLMAILIDVEK